MMRRLRNPLPRALAILLIAVCGFAQHHGMPTHGPRIIEGSVADNRGNLLPKSVVHLENMVTLEIRSYIVQGDGQFHFQELNPDVDFLIHAEYRGKLSKKLILSHFDSERHAPVKLVIPVE
jgi:hypothetical protein